MSAGTNAVATSHFVPALNLLAHALAGDRQPAERVAGKTAVPVLISLVENRHQVGSETAWKNTSSSVLRTGLSVRTCVPV